MLSSKLYNTIIVYGVHLQCNTMDKLFTVYNIEYTLYIILCTEYTISYINYSTDLLIDVDMVGLHASHVGDEVQGYQRIPNVWRLITCSYVSRTFSVSRRYLQA